MIVIDGQLKIVPSGMAFDTGELRVGDNVQPAVIQTLVSDDGQVQVVFPLRIIDQVVDGFTKAKEQAENEPTSQPDLLIPGSQQEAQEMIKQGEGIEKLKG